MIPARRSGLVAALIWGVLLPPWSAHSKGLIDVDRVGLETDAGGMHLKLTVHGIADRTCEDLEVILRLGRMELESDVSVIDDLMEGRSPSSLMTWTRIRLPGGAVLDEAVQLGALDEAPIESDSVVLVTERADRLFVRFRLAESLGPGEVRRVAFRLPFADKDPDRPLITSGAAIGCAVSDVLPSDAFRFMERGLVGAVVLLRSFGLEGDPARRQKRLAALQKRHDFALELVRAFEASLADDASRPDPLATAATLWLIPQVSARAFLTLTQRTLLGDKSARQRALLWADALDQRVSALRRTAPSLWSLAMSHLMPRSGPASLLVRLFAMAAQPLRPPDAATFLLAMGKVDSGEAELTARALVQVSAAGLLRGLETRPLGTVEEVLKLLAKWRVAPAVVTLLDASAWGTFIERVGRARLLSVASAMTRNAMPQRALDALGSSDKLLRAFALELVTTGRAPALQAVGERLLREGFPVRGHTDAQAYAKDPNRLIKLVGRLQGIVLAPLASAAEAEASFLHARGGDCLAPLDAARAALHPRLLMPEPLYSQCRALRALDLLGDGQIDAAEKLIGLAMRTAGDDPQVRERWVRIGVARGRRLLEQGDVAGAEGSLAEVDPNREHNDTSGLRAAIEALRGDQARAAGDLAAARRHYTEARRLDPSRAPADALLQDPGAPARRVLFSLLSLLLLSGVVATGVRWWRTTRSVKAVLQLTDEAPTRLTGPRSRRLFVAEHALLSLRSLSHRLIPWADVRAAHRIDGGSEDAGLLLLHGSGETFFISVAACDRFDELLDAVRPQLAAFSVEIEDSAPLGSTETVKQLLKGDVHARLLSRSALGLGVVAALIVTMMDLGTGLGLFGRLLAGAGLGCGLSLLTLGLPDTLLPRMVA